MTPAGTAAWVALLRGINVGGHRKVPMAELRALCVGAGFADVRTYIQSGNVVFRAPGRASAVARRLEDAIEGRFGFHVPVVLRSAAEMASVVAGNPFLAGGADPARLHVTFLAREPGPDVVERYRSHRSGPDELRLVGRHAYLHCPGGMARTKLTTDFMERAFGSATTTRNWRTTTTMAEMAGEP